EREDVGEHVVHAAREDLRERVYLVADLAEPQVVVRVAQADLLPERGAELLGERGQEVLRVQVRLGHGDERLGLVELREREEQRREVAERLVQRARLRRVAEREPAGLQPVQYRVAGLVRADVERAAREHRRRLAGRREVVELQRLLGPAVERVRGDARPRVYGQHVRVTVRVPRPRYRLAAAYALVQRQRLPHDRERVRAVGFRRIGDVKDEVAVRVPDHGRGALQLRVDARVARAVQDHARDVDEPATQLEHRRILFPDDEARPEL